MTLAGERIRQVIATVLLILGMVFPWNINFGLGIEGTRGWVLGLLIVATLMSLAALRAPHGPRLALTLPYLVMVLFFVGFAVLEAIRHGGTGSAPPGLGPGAWLGLAGAVLAAHHGGDLVQRSRVIGIASIALASVAAFFNLYLRTRFVLPNIAASDTSRQHLFTAVAALIYGLVALAPVIVVGGWMTRSLAQARPALVLLGASGLVSGILVWALPAGRYLDAFHGIAQSTSTAGVGFEGYLAWAAAAALIVASPGAGKLADELSNNWRATASRCLTLIAVWCAGSAALRVIDIALAAILDLPSSPYSSTVMMAVDLATALLAGWVVVNGLGNSIPKPATLLLVGTVFVMTVMRIVIDQALVSRVKPLDSIVVSPVWGNDLSQQITSIFDVTLCILALALFVSTTVAYRTSPRKEQHVELTKRSVA